MTRERAIKDLYQLQIYGYDTEADHSTADRILCELLKALGYEDVVAAWDKIPKWYA